MGAKIKITTDEFAVSIVGQMFEREAQLGQRTDENQWALSSVRFSSLHSQSKYFEQIEKLKIVLIYFRKLYYEWNSFSLFYQR